MKSLHVSKWIPTAGNILFTLLIAVLLLYAQRANAFPDLSVPEAPSTANTILSYQGRLADSNGTPLTTTVAMTFNLYNVASGGIPVWSESWASVSVNDGLFNLLLGSTIPIPQSIIAENTSLWLGVEIGNDSEMTPRVQVGSTPFAMQALTVPDGTITTLKLADASVTTNKLNILDGLQMNGDLVITGQITNTVNVMTQFATTTTDGAGTANIEAYLAVLKPAHYWMGCQGGQTYWNTDYEFDYNASIGQITNLPPNCKVIIYYLNYPEGDGNPIHSPPDW